MIEALAAENGIVSLVGAGGKKSLLYHLASAHPGKVGVTATVHIPYFPVALQALEVIVDEDADLALEVSAAHARRVAFAREPGKRGRWAGIAPELVAVVHRRAGFDLTLVKADGARGLLVKAPGDGEPRIPAASTTVLPVVSAAVLGRRLNPDEVHRRERFYEVTGLQPGRVVQPRHLAALLTSASGALKDVGEAKVIPVINMVDDDATERLAREAAEQTLARSDRLERVVLTCMRKETPLVAVVER